MRVVFRTDASTTIGSGHVIRCLTLAERLREDGAEALFVCREHHGHLCALLEAHGMAVAQLPLTGGRAEDRGIYGDWLGARCQEDVEQTQAAIEARWSGRADWLIVDHYAIDARWETALRPFARRVMTIDDLADRHHDCDLLLDQNLVGGMEGRYRDLVPAGCVTLLGPRYALLASEYADLHGKAAPRRGPVQAILVFFGSTDPFELTEKTVWAFLQLGRPDIRLDVVTGRLTGEHQMLQDICARHENIRVHRNLPSLAPMMMGADLAIGAGGATSWERLCLRLPALVVTVAPNQEASAGGLETFGFAKLIGSGEQVGPTELLIALQDSLSGAWVNQDIWRHAPADGLGCRRVADKLAVGLAKLAARPAQAGDEKLLLEWANDPVTRSAGLNPAEISPEVHHRWLTGKLADPNCLLLIIHGDEGPIGQVRFDRDQSGWVLSYAVAPGFRGRGLASLLLRHAISGLAHKAPKDVITAIVKPSNVASRKTLESVGFEIHSITSFAIEYRLQMAGMGGGSYLA